MATRRKTNTPETGAQRRDPEGKTSSNSDEMNPQHQQHNQRQQQPDVGEQRDVNDELMEDEELETQGNNEEEDMI